MQIKEQLRKVLTGLTFYQEYLCLSQKELQGALRVFLTTPDSLRVHDVTNAHLLLGYKPLVIALVLHEHKANLAQWDKICLHMNQTDFETNMIWHGSGADKGSVARLELSKKFEKEFIGMTLYFYEGAYGVHTFLNPFYRWINTLREKVRIRPDSNVSLLGNLYEQVRIAYAIPRSISVITVSDGILVNMFPTDLHGAASEKFYIGSLRIGGKANQQVEKYRRITVSSVDSSRYRETYALGRNHMRELRDRQEFACQQKVSEVFRHLLPPGVLSYHELMWKDSMDIGIHRIHIYEIVSFHEVSPSGASLVHVHQYYAQWRMNHGLKTEYLLR